MKFQLKLSRVGIQVFVLLAADSARYISIISVGLALVFLLVVIGVTAYKLMDGSIETPKWLPNVTDSAAFFNLFTAVPVVVFAYICHYNGIQDDHLFIFNCILCFFTFNNLFSCATERFRGKKK